VNAYLGNRYPEWVNRSAFWSFATIKEDTS
jgi:hypothetical protein